MALTLIEAAKQSKDELQSAVIELYAMSSNLLRVIPFDDIPGNAHKYDQEQALPGVGFRGVNEGYTESTGVINPMVEPLVIAGGDLDVDIYILKTQGEGKRAQQEAMKIKALAHNWTHNFFKGDTSTDPKSFDGLQKRLTGPQLVAAGSASGGDALSLAILDQAIDRTDNPTHIAMSKAMRRRFTQAARTTSVSGYITYDKDEFGRPVTKYNDLPILVIGENDDFYNTLDFTEANPGGGANVGCSIYILSLGAGYLQGIQNGPADVRDLGELDTKPVMRTRVEWYCGVTLEHPRAATRLYGVKDAAITA